LIDLQKCVFKGLSPELDSFDRIRQIQRPTDIPDSGIEIIYAHIIITI